MQAPAPGDLTRLLHDWGHGSESALRELTALIYRELRSIAAGYLRRERPNHTLQPTALVNEMYLRLAGQAPAGTCSRAQLFAITANLMRQILVDHARRRNAAKRAAVSGPLDSVVSFEKERSVDLLALDSGLNELEKLDPRKCKAVELRYFVGLSMEEIAQTLAVSEMTVRRDLRMAEVWLQNQIEGG